MQRDIVLRGALFAALMFSATMVACSSDPFGATGSSLPAEVTQDSVAVQAAPIYPVDVQVVEPDLGQPFEDRNRLYVGRRERDANHDRGEWTLTPILKFDFAMFEGDTLLTDTTTWKEIKLRLPRRRWAGERAGNRQFALANLSAEADASMATVPLASILADTFLDATDAGDVNDTDPFEILLYDSDIHPANWPPFLLFQDWIDGDVTHLGLAVLDASPSVEDSLSLDNTIDQLRFEDAKRPDFWVRFVPPGLDDHTTRYEAQFGVTNVEREDPPAGRLRLGTHLASRVWLQFDLNATEVPGNATVNRATLLLSPDNEFSLGEFFGTLRAYESDLVDVETVALSKATRIRRGVTDFVAIESDSLGLDLTDYFQRFVNGVIPSDRGVMLGISVPSELADLIDLELFGDSAADVTLRPQLDVIYTPPADFQEKR